LVLHPDILLTATSLSGAPQCGRKPLVANLVRATFDSSPALVWGNMLHQIMQSCLIEGCWDDQFMNQEIDRVAHEMLPELLRINTSVQTAKQEVKARAKGLKQFSQKYMSQTPKVSLFCVFDIIFH
jgi:DNA replication ATP-dependent helicase Dna2